MIYLLTKTFHLLFVIAWLAAVFYLPRILVNLAEVRGHSVVEQRLTLMGRRLYRFGHLMFGLTFVLGALLWFGFRVFPGAYPHVTAGSGWMHAKFLLVLLLLGFFIWSGKLLKKAVAGDALPTSRTLRWFNEIPVLFALGVLVLAVVKPF